MEMAQPSDMELVNAAKSGENNAFRILVGRYKGQVAVTVFGMLGYGGDAEDVGQEVFIRFYKSLGSFRGESTVGTYLTRIAINLSLNEIKKRKVRALLLMRKSRDDMFFKQSESGELEMDNKEIVKAAIGKLKSAYRSVVVLRLINGYSTREAANILKVPEGTVLSRLKRAQDILRRLLKVSLEGEYAY
jgi:RNA polymerase sigma-70 factor (ECF subfamily)